MTRNFVSWVKYPGGYLSPPTRILALAFLLFALCYTALGQEPPKPDYLHGKSEVDWTEVGRRGTKVTSAGEGIRNGSEIMQSIGLATPEDDSGRWHFSLWGKSTDPKCLAIVEAFQNDRLLSPFFAEPPRDVGGKPWAHFNWYKSDDPMQRWRYTEYQLDPKEAEKNPVIFFQPPRDGSFGGITTVKVNGKERTRQAIIDRISLSEVPTALAFRKRVDASYGKWCDTLAKANHVPPQKLIQRLYSPEPTAAPTEDERAVSTPAGGSHAALPVTETVFQPTADTGASPWGEDPPAPTMFNASWPQGGPAAVPTPAGINLPLGLLSGLIPSFSTILLLFTALSNVAMFWMEWRNRAKVAGTKLPLKDTEAERMLSILKMLKLVPADAAFSPGPPPVQTPMTPLYRKTETGDFVQV
jgi:hypothetical protein